MGNTQADLAEAQLRAGVYARLSETYDAAESVPTQLERGTDHAIRRGWQVAATFKDDGYSGFKEITRDGFAELIAAIEAASRSDQHGHARGAGATRAEQITMWEAWWQANRAAVPQTGPLTWVLTLDAPRLAGSHLPAPDVPAPGRGRSRVTPGRLTPAHPDTSTGGTP
jgi:hypothetical protein